MPNLLFLRSAGIGRSSSLKWRLARNSARYATTEARQTVHIRQTSKTYKPYRLNAQTGASRAGDPGEPPPYLPLMYYPLRLQFLVALNLFMLGHFFANNVGSIRLVAGMSMAPTIEDGNWTVHSSRYNGGNGVQVGDLVSFVHPINRNQRAIKRIIGMPGDFVLRDSPPGCGVLVNNEQGETIDVADDPGDREHWMVQVPKGHCWLAGDNVPFTRDSRHYGPVPLALVRSKVVMKMPSWSLKPWNWTWFSSSEDYWPGVRANLGRSINRDKAVKYGQLAPSHQEQDDSNKG
ncbi:MAG: hypothetical protein M1828_002683 [Chrysothrix sp. TS-e1954]|nr:MAG: hypothetical protein M1828_002683 [Chrysothrix sp. TS-e1954]